MRQKIQLLYQKVSTWLMAGTIEPKPTAPTRNMKAWGLQGMALAVVGIFVTVALFYLIESHEKKTRAVQKAEYMREARKEMDKQRLAKNPVKVHERVHAKMKAAKKARNEDGGKIEREELEVQAKAFVDFLYKRTENGEHPDCEQCAGLEMKPHKIYTAFETAKERAFRDAFFNSHLKAFNAYATEIFDTRRDEMPKYTEPSPQPTSIPTIVLNGDSTSSDAASDKGSKAEVYQNTNDCERICKVADAPAGVNTHIETLEPNSPKLITHAPFVDFTQTPFVRTETGRVFERPYHPFSPRLCINKFIAQKASMSGARPLEIPPSSTHIEFLTPEPVGVQTPQTPPVSEHIEFASDMALVLPTTDNVIAEASAPRHEPVDIRKYRRNMADHAMREQRRLQSEAVMKKAQAATQVMIDLNKMVAENKERESMHSKSAEVETQTDAQQVDVHPIYKRRNVVADNEEFWVCKESLNGYSSDDEIVVVNRE